MLTILSLTFSFLAAISAAFLLGAWWASIHAQHDLDEALRYAAAWKSLAYKWRGEEARAADHMLDTDTSKYKRRIRAQ